MTPFNSMLLFFLLLPIIQCLELCTFNEGTCEWDIKPPWNVVSLAILPRHSGFLIQSKTPDVITSDGPFLLAQGKFASIPSSRVISQRISKSDHMRILSYRYQRRGKATLRIILKNGTDEILLDTISQNELERNKWHRRSVIFPPIPSDDQTNIIFESDNIQTSEDVIAVDEIDVATPANVMWAGQDSKFFDEEDIRRREIRRSSKVSKVCSPISCSFRSTLCSWKSSNIQMLPNKIVNEASGESVLTSTPVRLSIDQSSFIQLQMFDSQGSITSLFYRNIGSMNENIVWTEEKSKIDSESSETRNGWNRILIPLESIPKGIPVILIIKSTTGSNDFVAFSSIDLVDKNQKTMSCGIE
uniref:MAM domain-containing protein n=1 Tax=Caenorhabditis tropicalis TaxID=1561998 RepID=A0A1I7UXK5_9PELO